jgi:hypothetical protein
MARKTTKAAQAAIIRYTESVVHMEHVINIRNTQPECNWTSFTKQCTPEFVEGYMTGMKNATESVIHQQECYHGFNYIGPDGKRLIRGELESIDQHPDYRDWRVMFLVQK